MKYLITERQFRLLKEEDTEEPVVPKKIQVIDYEFWDNNWYELQDHLNRNEIRKKTPYILRGDVDLSLTDIKTLGSLVGVDGSLDLRNNKIIEDLGNLQSVGGNLYLYKTNITSLENLQSVGGDLNLNDMYIKSLGNLQGVGGRLDLMFTNITSLENLEYVGSDLNLYNSKIESLGNLKFVSGNLDLGNTPLSETTTKEEILNMPNLTIEGEIYL